MRKAVGFLLIIIFFLGTIFFRYYSGTVIPYPILWYISFFALGLLGVWLFSSSIRKAKNIIEQVVNTETEKSKSNAEIIELIFENCEFKTGSFSHQVDDPRMSGIFIGSDPLASIEPKITETVIQSYLIYTGTINGTVCKFVSPSFPFDQTTLEVLCNQP